MHWGRGIALVIIVFMISIVSVVIYTMTLDVNLVAEDYYKQELVYEDQITRLKNTEALAEKPSFQKSADGKLIILSFPKDLKPKKGQITLYRPSDFKQDRTFNLQLDNENQQGFHAESMQPGLWRAKILWDMENKSYFQEFIIVI